MTSIHYFAFGVGAAGGLTGLIWFLVVNAVRRDPDDPWIDRPFPSDGEADLKPRAESFADVKDTF